MRNKIHIVLILILQLNTVFQVEAQSHHLQKADRYFSQKEFSLAIKHYEDYLEAADDFEVKLKLASCYQFLHRNSEAISLYASIIKNPLATPKHYLEYAQLLKQDKRYQQAKTWFQKYKEFHPEDKLVNDLIRSCDLINELKNDSLYIIRPLNINSPQSDFASDFYRDGIVFLSGRPNRSSSSIDGRTGEHYLDLYYTEKRNDSYQKPVAFSRIFNSKYHEGPACFSSNERFIYFTRNKQGVNLEGKSELNIYTARFNGKNWDKPELFQFSGYYYSMGHPSISPDGQYLYFISNMEGGYGGTDIYICYKQGFGWSRPINLGPSINTSGNEMFPNMSEDGYLYFASDGHIGLGGLDIFKSFFDHNRWSTPVNMGPPFNSSRDDFGYFINTNKTHGYFSSNRPGGKGGDDIYEFILDTNRIVQMQGGITRVGDHTPLAGVEVSLVKKQSLEGITQTDANGNFRFSLAPHQDYSLIIRKPGFKTKRILYFHNQYKDHKNTQVNIMLEPSTWQKLSGNVSDEYSRKNLKDVSVQVINKTYNIKHLLHTDANGNFQLDIDPEKTYSLIIKRKGYFTKVINNYKFQDSKIENIHIQRIAKNRYMELNGSKFNQGDWLLTNNTETELENLANLMINNPNIAIEIGAYTYQDNGKKANERLCEKRAQEAASFIITKGIAPNRINLKPLGYDTDHAQLVVKVIEAF